MLNLYNELTSRFENTELILDRDPERQIVLSSVESIRDVAQYLNEEIGFDHVISVSVVDQIEENKLVVAYHLASIGNPDLWQDVLTLEVELDRDSPKVPSLCDIWPSAEFSEREGWEMFGVDFDGHPKLERLLLPESWEGGYPLRKDFKLGEERK